MRYSKLFWTSCDLRRIGLSLLFFIFSTNVYAVSPLPMTNGEMNKTELIRQLQYSLTTFSNGMVSEEDQVPLALNDLRNKTCPNSSEVTHKGLARNPDKIYAYAQTFYDGIQILKSDPKQVQLVQQLQDAIFVMGGAMVTTKIVTAPDKWGWNNLSSNWDAWGNGTCSGKDTPNVYASAKALLTLQLAFELSSDKVRKQAYFDAFLGGVSYWLSFSSNPLLANGSNYLVKTKSYGLLDAKGINNFYQNKPNLEIFNLAIVGGQRTDFCPGPGCNDYEKDLNSKSYLSTAYTLVRPFRFQYTKDDPGLVTVNCSGLMGLAFLKMGMTLRTLNDQKFPMPNYKIPMISKDGKRTSSTNKDLYYIGYWTIYSLYYNLAQQPANASYNDVDTPLYVNTAYEAHLATLSAPVLAQAGSLLKRSDYVNAAVRSVKESESSIIATIVTKSSSARYAFCMLRNLDSEFADQCSSLVNQFILNSKGEATKYMSPGFLGVAISQRITNP